MAENAILRGDLSTLIPEQKYSEIVQGAIQQSAVLQHARRLPNMGTRVASMNVLASLPSAGFINGDTAIKPLTKAAWGEKKIYAEELACIVPIPENVVADASIDVFSQVKPLIQQEMGRAIDGAILFGVNKPSSWRGDILATATTAGKVVTATADTCKDIMDEDGVIAKVEESGTLPTYALAAVQMRAKLRGLRDTAGAPLFKTDMQGATPYALDGIPMDFPLNGAFDPTKALMILGDFSKLVYAVRQDLSFKVLTEATLIDPATKEIQYALAQQDMIALRCVMRLGWEVLDPISAYTTDEKQRFPFAVYAPAVGG